MTAQHLLLLGLLTVCTGAHVPTDTEASVPIDLVVHGKTRIPESEIYQSIVDTTMLEAEQKVEDEDIEVSDKRNQEEISTVESIVVEEDGKTEDSIKVLEEDHKEDEEDDETETVSEAIDNMEDNPFDSPTDSPPVEVVDYKGWSVLKVEGFFAAAEYLKANVPGQVGDDQASAAAAAEDCSHYPLEDLEERPDVRVLQEHRQEDFYHIAVAPQSRQQLVRELGDRRLRVTDLHVDLGGIIEETNNLSFRSELPKGEATFDRYMTLQQIEDFIFEFTARHPQIVKHSVIGKSVEGRDIHMLSLTMGDRLTRQLPPSQHLHPNSVEQTMAALADLIRWSESYKKVGALNQEQHFKEQAAIISEPFEEKVKITSTEETFQTIGVDISYELEKYRDDTTRKTYATLHEIMNHEEGENKNNVVLKTKDDTEPINKTFKLLQSIINEEQPNRRRRAKKDTSIIGVLNRISKSLKSASVSPINNSQIESDVYADIIFLMYSVIPKEYINNVTIVYGVKNSIVTISKELPDDKEITQNELDSLIPQIMNVPGVVGITSGGVNSRTGNILKLAELLNILNITDISNNGTNADETSTDAVKQDSLHVTMERSSNKPVILVDGGIHAREWVSPAFLMYLLQQLASDTSLLLGAEWRLVPVLNPDGYVHTWTGDRLWRKNRAHTSGCRGVDLNRNFGYKFGGAGTSSRTCSEIYRGPHAFSEPESKALKSAVEAAGHRLKAYVSVHSYGQMILHPWGYTANVQHSRKKQLDAMGRGMAAAIKAVSGQTYVVGSASGILYSAAGGSDDWVSSVGSPYSYTMELRDKGAAGFVLPAGKIKPTVKETWAAIKYLGEKIIEEKTRSASPPKALTPDQVIDPSSLFTTYGITAPFGPVLRPTEIDALPYAALQPLFPGFGVSNFQPVEYPTAPKFQQPNVGQFYHGYNAQRPANLFHPQYQLPLSTTNTHNLAVNTHSLFINGHINTYGTTPNEFQQGSNEPNIILPTVTGDKTYHHGNLQGNSDYIYYTPMSPLQHVIPPFFRKNPIPSIYKSPLLPTNSENERIPIVNDFSEPLGTLDEIRAHFKSPFYMSSKSTNLITVDPNTGFSSFRPSVQYSAHQSFIPYSSPMIVKHSTTNPYEEAFHNTPSGAITNIQTPPGFENYFNSKFIGQQQETGPFSQLPRLQLIPSSERLPTKNSEFSNKSPVFVSLGNVFGGRSQTLMRHSDPLQRSSLIEPLGELVPIEYWSARQI